MIIFGKQCFEYVLQKAPQSMQEIYFSKEINSTVFAKIRRLNIPILRIDNKKAQALAHGKNHQGMFAKIADIRPTALKNIYDMQSVVVLCGITDVGNIGSIVRSAYALGVNGVVLCDRSELNTQTLEGVFRASSGALLSMPFGFCHSSLDFAHEAKMHNFLLLGGGVLKNQNTLDGKCKKWALFIGQEDTGLRQRLIAKLDQILHIPMYNGFNSLNASVATGILIDRIQHTILQREMHV